MKHETTVRYVDGHNTAITLKEVDSHLVPDYRQRVQLDNDIIGHVDAVEWRISDEKTIAVIKLNLDYDDLDTNALPENHPNFTDEEDKDSE